jgi:hypothetical protein
VDASPPSSSLGATSLGATKSVAREQAGSTSSRRWSAEGSALGVLIVTGIFVAQVWASTWWLQRHRFGPIEARKKW